AGTALSVGAVPRVQVATGWPFPSSLNRVPVGVERAVVDGGRPLLVHPDRHRVALEFADVRERVAVVCVQAAGDCVGRLGAGLTVVSNDLQVGVLHAFAACPAALDQEEAAFTPLPAPPAPVLPRGRPVSDPR